MELFENLKAAQESPAMLHAMMIHMPIALSVLGLIFAVVAAVRQKSKWLRAMAIVLYAILTLNAYMAANSGGKAEDAIRGGLTSEAEDRLEKHEELGEKVWLLGGSVLALLMISTLPHKHVRLIAHLLAIVVGGYTWMHVANTAHEGGVLVYEHGVGVKKPKVIEPGKPMAVPTNPSPASGGGAGTQPTTQGAAIPGGAASVAYFREVVRPILEENCLRCHNPRKTKGGLDQTTREGLLAGGESGPAIVAGKAEASLLIKAVRHEAEDLEMPPDGEQLGEAQISALEAWIEAGASWEAFTWEGASDEGQGNS